MRQVPASYLILGDGRVARHIRRYFDLEAIPHIHWSRSLNRPLDTTGCTHALLLLSDRAISEFYEEHPSLHSLTCVHFSGALTHERIHGAHPLQTFSERAFSLAEYREIPFVTEQGRATFRELFPSLANPSFEIELEKKALYHALCSLSGNFTVLLWEKAFSRFHSDLGLPKGVLLPYLRRVTENLAASSSGDSVLTGPLTRGDQATIDKHLRALNGDPFARVYEAFVQAYAEGVTK